MPNTGFTTIFKNNSTQLASVGRSSYTTWIAEVNYGAAAVPNPPYFTKILITNGNNTKTYLDSSKVVGKLGDVLNNPIMVYNGTL